MVQQLITQELSVCIGNGHLCVRVYGSWWFVSQVGSRRIWLEKGLEHIQLQLNLKPTVRNIHLYGVAGWGTIHECLDGNYYLGPQSASFSAQDIWDRVKNYAYDPMVMENDKAIKGRLVFKLPEFDELRVW